MCVHACVCLCMHVCAYVCAHMCAHVHMCEIPDDFVVCTCVLLGDHQPQDRSELAGRFSGGGLDADMPASLLLGVGRVTV